MSIPFDNSSPPILIHGLDNTLSKSLPPLPKELLAAITNHNSNTRPYQSISTTTSSSNKSAIDSAILSSSSTSSSSSSCHTNIMKNEKEEREDFSFSPMYEEQTNKSVITNSGSNYDLSYYFYSSSNNNSTTTTNTYSNTTTPEEEKAAEEDEDNTISTSSRRTSSLLYRERSLSIGSTISSRHYISSSSSTTATAFNEYHDISTFNNNNFNNYVADPLISCKVQQQIYKHKNDKSNKKAYQFFGEQIKLEISAKEIKREGLKALLFSTVPLGYFLYHLLNEYSSENLFFFLAVENYQCCDFTNDLERQQTANKIAKAYLTRNADLEVNLEDRIYRAVKKALLEQQRMPSISTGNEFDAAKRHVLSLLNVSYHGFRTSSIWDIMESKCNDMNNFNRERSQALVVNLLLSYIKRNNNNTSLFKLVHSFCKIYLPYGYESRSSSPTKEKKLIIKENNSSSKCSNSSSTTNRRNRSKSLGGSDKKGSFISSKFDNIFCKNNNKIAR